MRLVALHSLACMMALVTQVNQALERVASGKARYRIVLETDGMPSP